MRTIILLSNIHGFLVHSSGCRLQQPIFMEVLTGKNGLYEIARLTEINLLPMMESGFGFAHRVHRPSVYK
jgi:hypothetical protein